MIGKVSKHKDEIKKSDSTPGISLLAVSNNLVPAWPSAYEQREVGIQ